MVGTLRGNPQQKRKQIHLLKALDVPAGAWQIFWFGRLTESPNAKQTPFIRAYLARVQLSEGLIVARLPDVRHIDLPISDLPALPLGTVFDDRLIVPAMPLHPAATWEDITVDFSRQNLCFFERVAAEPNDTQFLPHGRRTPKDDQEYEGILLTAGDDTNPHAFVFPCATIFQFFWARSSRWAQLMVDGRFVDYNRHIFDARNSYLSRDGSAARLWLRQWMLDDDAAFIATLAFDEYALCAGADIYKYLAQPPREAHRRCIRALPPYQGHLPLRVLQQPITTRRGPAMLIQCISSCGYIPLIRELKFDRDNDGRTVDEVAHEHQGDKPPMNRPQFGGPPVTLLDESVTITNDPHASQKDSIEISMAHLADSLPGLSSISVEKLPQTDIKYVNQQEAWLRLRQWSKEISTLIDALSSGEMAPEGLIRGENHTDELDTDDTTPVRGNISELAHVLLSRKHFEILHKNTKWKAEPSLIVMPNQQGRYFSVPSRVDGMALAWLYRDEEKSLRKRAICIRVTFTHISSSRSRIRYLLDFEPRTIDGALRQNRILFFWNKENALIPEENRSISSLVKAIAKKGQAGIPKTTMDGLEGSTRNHPRTGAPPDRFLKSMLEAVDRM